MRFEHREGIGKAKLDLKDKKILALLCQNARTSSTAIAKKVGLSRDAVSYRINNYIKNNIIIGFKTIIDISKLGYDSYHLFLQLNQPKKEIEKELINKFKNYNFVRAILKFHGKFDYELAIIAKDLKEFDSIFNKIIEDCSDYLQYYEILPIIKSYKITSTLPRSFYDFKINNITKDQKIEMDETDRKILSVISEKASIPFYTIAKNLNLSPDTIIYRIKKLINSGIIINFTPVINYASLNYNIYAVLLQINNLKDQKESTLKQFLNSDKNILWAVKTLGKFNVLIYVCVNNTEDLHETLLNLRNYFPNDIKDYETLIAYEEFKYTYYPF